ncbi:MAG: histidine kinase [Nostoc sp.]
MGSGEDEGDEGDKQITNAQCPMPNAQCPMPNAPT